jgi:phage portal protein BeeE
MSLLDRLTDRYRSGYWEGMASGASVLTVNSGMDPKRESGVQSIATAAAKAYESNGVVFACTLVRMMMLAEATFKYRSLKDKHLFGNPDLQLLEYPWLNATAGELWARMEQQSSLHGNAFVAKVADDELLVLPADEVVIVSEVVTSSTGVKYKRPIGYDWDPNRLPGVDSKATAQFFTVDEVAHWSPIPDPSANFRGMSWLTPVLRDVAGDSAMTAYKAMYMDHGSPVVAVKYDRPLKPETVDYLIQRIKAKYGGVNNAWNPLVFDQGADPVMSAGLDQLDFRNIQAGGELRICAAAGVSPILIGLRPSDGGDSYQTAMRQFGDMHMRPLWRSACASLQKLVAVPADSQLWYDTSDIAALQAAETEKAQVTQVSAAALLTFIQAGMTPESAVLAVNSGDLSLLVPDPNAEASGDKTGQAPGVQSVLTKPQTPASKMPMPASLSTMPTATGRPRAPSVNGGN